MDFSKFSFKGSGTEKGNADQQANEGQERTSDGLREAIEKYRPKEGRRLGPSSPSEMMEWADALTPPTRHPADESNKHLRVIAQILDSQAAELQALREHSEAGQRTDKIRFRITVTILAISVCVGIVGTFTGIWIAFVD
jgi:hypothetical protein